MNLVISSSDDPYYNLATEEYLLKNSSEDFLLLYINKPCVVVGKHQNTQKEINPGHIFKNNVLIARRLSGGGAVYHDHGNLNFSFIQTLSPGENVSYPKITRPLVHYLKTEVDPLLELNQRNDFLLQGKKISGSAMHLYKNRVLAHGTLLVNCDLKNLSAALKGNTDHYMDKAIASRRAEVRNLTNSENQLTAYSILQQFSIYQKSVTNTKSDFRIDPIGVEMIQKLASEKYSTRNWIYGYSPKYKYCNEFVYNNQLISYCLEIEKGVIEVLLIESDNEVNSDIILKLNNLKGLEHNFELLQNQLNSTVSSDLDRIIFHSLF